MALSLRQVNEIFGAFEYREAGGGAVAPDPAWVAANIVEVEAPFILPTPRGRTRRVRAHRKVAGLIAAALEDLAAQGLARLIGTWDGCFVPRHICWDKTRGLSRHAWGMALDVNAGRFRFGSRRRQDARLVLAFERQGFRCGQMGGGLWKNPRHWDPMHFEFVDLDLLPEDEAGDAGAVRVEIGSKVLPGRLEAGRVVAPVREVAEALGARVEWDAATRRVIISRRGP